MDDVRQIWTEVKMYGLITDIAEQASLFRSRPVARKTVDDAIATPPEEWTPLQELIFGEACKLVAARNQLAERNLMAA